MAIGSDVLQTRTDNEFGVDSHDAHDQQLELLKSTWERICIPNGLGGLDKKVMQFAPISVQYSGAITV